MPMPATPASDSNAALPYASYSSNSMRQGLVTAFPMRANCSQRASLACVRSPVTPPILH